MVFICGAADRSGRGKRCSSCWCWGGIVFVLTMYSFLGCEKEKPCLKRGVKRQNLCLKRGVKKQKLCLKKGFEKAKTWSQKLVDQSYFPIFSSFMNYVYSTPQISERIPFLLCFLTGVSVRTFECRGYLFFHAARGIGPLLEFLISLTI